MDFLQFFHVHTKRDRKHIKNNYNHQIFGTTVPSVIAYKVGEFHSRKTKREQFGNTWYEMLLKRSLRWTKKINTWMTSIRNITVYKIIRSLLCVATFNYYKYAWVDSELMQIDREINRWLRQAFTDWLKLETSPNSLCMLYAICCLLWTSVL